MLYAFLTAVTKGEAFDLVKNVPDLCGAEAWRKLAKRFGGRTRGKRVVLTRRCVNPPKVKKLSEAPGMIEKWESDMRRLKTDYNEELSDGLKCGILLEMVPNHVAEFMTQRMEEDDTYLDTKETVLRYVETKADFGGPTPMELDALGTAGISDQSLGEMAWPGDQSVSVGEQWDTQDQSGLMAFGGKGGKGKGGKGGVYMRGMRTSSRTMSMAAAASAEIVLPLRPAWAYFEPVPCQNSRTAEGQGEGWHQRLGKRK